MKPADANAAVPDVGGVATAKLSMSPSASVATAGTDTAVAGSVTTD